jgi:RNA polymerase-binding protein DksA
MAHKLKTPATIDQSGPQIPPKWAWHYQRLQSLLDSLQEDRDIHMSEAHEPLESHSMDIADSATDEFDHDIALSLLSHERNALVEVRAALRRIQDGSYGICEETGQPIPAARLRAVPWTRHTRDVEERLERRKMVGHPQLGQVTSLQGSGAGGLSQTEEPENEELLTREVLRHRREANLEAIRSGADSGAANQGN